jgi:hypothetical protein
MAIDTELHGIGEVGTELDEQRPDAHCQLFFNMGDNYFLTLSQVTFFI